jgi:hypothetical protein
MPVLSSLALTPALCCRSWPSLRTFPQMGPVPAAPGSRLGPCGPGGPCGPAGPCAPVPASPGSPFGLEDRPRPVPRCRPGLPSRPEGRVHPEARPGPEARRLLAGRQARSRRSGGCRRPARPSCRPAGPSSPSSGRGAHVAVVLHAKMNDPVPSGMVAYATPPAAPSTMMDATKTRVVRRPTNLMYSPSPVVTSACLDRE